MYNGQYKQDKYLDNLFKRKQNGVFIDIGAHDGKTFSNSLFFEQQRNWTGICVEPIPEIFEKLKQQRNCIKVNGCIAEKKRHTNFFKSSRGIC